MRAQLAAPVAIHIHVSTGVGTAFTRRTDTKSFCGRPAFCQRTLPASPRALCSRTLFPVGMSTAAAASSPSTGRATPASATSSKVVLVTGASSGIGRASALAFGAAGYQVVATARNVDALAEVCREIVAAGGDASHCKLDVTDADSCRAAAAFAVATFGRVDCLVNAAGVLKGGHADKIDVDNWDFNMNINGRGAFCMMTACIPALKETKGNIVHVSSVTGQQSFEACLSYCASKAAVDMMVRCAAVDLAPHGVRVNSVNPGVIVTELHKRAGQDDATYAKFLEHSKVTHPIGRVGNPEEVAATILFLASGSAGFITGVNLTVDGGRKCVGAR